LILLFRGKKHARPFTKVRRANSYVYCNVQRFAFHDAADFCLWVTLLVKTAERPFAGTPMVVLHEGIRDAEVGELRLVEGFDEEVAGVGMNNRPQFKHTRKACLYSLH
jgi:hypothetical protein